MNVGNWLGEICTTIGTGTLELGGNINPSFAKFSDAISNGETVWYALIDGENREAGSGVYSSNTLTRASIESTIFNGLYSGSSPTPISLSGGAQVFCTFNKAAYDYLVAQILTNTSDIIALTTQVTALSSQVAGKENSLLNPPIDGYVISSTAAGVRSWVPQTPPAPFSMDPLVYDPQGVTDDAFDRSNHTGQQAISTIIDLQNQLNSKVNQSLVAVSNGIATLDANGKVPTIQLPAYVDDVLEYANLAAFPITGESGKIYVALDTNKTYRWSGSSYVYITSGAVDSVFGRTGVVFAQSGDYTKAQVGLGNVDNTSDVDKPVSTAQALAINAKVSDSISDGVINIAPSQNAVYDALLLKQAVLLSGSNIRTINSITILGSGSIDIVDNGGINVSVSGNQILLENAHQTIQSMTDTFFGTLNVDDVIKWDGSSFVNGVLAVSNISGLQTLLDGKSSIGGVKSITADYSVIPADMNYVLVVDSVTPVNIEVSQAVCVPGFTFAIYQKDVGQATILQNDMVIRTPNVGHNKTASQYAVVSCLSVDGVDLVIAGATA